MKRLKSADLLLARNQINSEQMRTNPHAPGPLADEVMKIVTRVKKLWLQCLQLGARAKGS